MRRGHPGEPAVDRHWARSTCSPSRAANQPGSPLVTTLIVNGTPSSKASSWKPAIRSLSFSHSTAHWVTTMGNPVSLVMMTSPRPPPLLTQSITTLRASACPLSIVGGLDFRATTMAMTPMTASVTVRTTRIHVARLSASSPQDPLPKARDHHRGHRSHAQPLFRARLDRDTCARGSAPAQPCPEGSADDARCGAA